MPARNLSVKFSFLRYNSKANFDDITPNEIGSDRLADIEESIDSFNAYRVQVNQSLLNLREELNELELALSQAENE